MFKYVPDSLRTPSSLVVALHGCSQTAASYDDETGWIRLAEHWSFALLLPEQTPRNNFNRCFNWFDPGDNRRGEGEALSIKQMIDRMRADHAIAPDRIYITGLSAGAAMTGVMLATYPDVLAGGAIIAGLPYGCATNFMTALSCMKLGRNLSPMEWGDRVRQATNYRGPWPRVSIWQGGLDALVLGTNARELVEQWTNVHGIDAIPDIQEMVKGYPHLVYTDANGRALVESYVITGMGHGMPVDPGPAEDQCGAPHPFIIDADICASYYIALFWGLDKGGASAASGMR